MTPAQLKRLQREWDEALKDEGLGNIESPSGMIPSVLSHGVSNARLQALGDMEPDRRLLGRADVFREPWERKAWELHCEGHSNRAIAAKLCVYRKLVDKAFHRLRAERDRRRPGRPRVPDGKNVDSKVVSFRLSDLELEALTALESKFAAGKRRRSSLITRLIVEFAQQL